MGGQRKVVVGKWRQLYSNINKKKLKKIIYLFLESGEWRDKERERNINVCLSLMRPLLGTWPATRAFALTGNRTSDPLVHRPTLNPLSHTSQGWNFHFLNFCLRMGEKHFCINFFITDRIKI